jgi:hypothetical protein
MLGLVSQTCSFFFINTVVALASLPIFDAEWVGGLPVLLMTVVGEVLCLWFQPIDI